MSLNHDKCRPVPTFSHSSALFSVNKQIACFNGLFIHSPADLNKVWQVLGVPPRRGFGSRHSGASLAGWGGGRAGYGENRRKKRS